MRPLLTVLALALLAGCAGGGGVREATASIPMARPDGTGRSLFARVCHPTSSAAGASPIVVINHGAGYGSERLAMQPQGCDTESVRWFTDRGYLAVLPMRRGYGQTGGVLSETSGACEVPDYVGSGLIGAQDIDSAVRWAAALPGAKPDGAVVVGQSVGGWAVVAYDSVPHPKVSAMIAMAPGRGGWAGGKPGDNCRPDLLASSAAYFAATSTTPMLWLFAANDSYYPPAVAAPMAKAYQAAGGRLTFEQLESFGSEGHALFQGSGGSAVWGPLVERYLRARLPTS